MTDLDIKRKLEEKLPPVAVEGPIVEEPLWRIRLRLARMVDDPDPRVRYQLAFTVGEYPLEWRVPVLAALPCRL